MKTKTKEIIRDIKLYELGIKDKLDGYDILMDLRGLKPFRTEYPNVTHYGKSNDIKFIHYDTIDNGFIYIKQVTWHSIGDSFNLSYDEVQELTMWSIGSDPKLEGVPTKRVKRNVKRKIGSDPNLEGIPTQRMF